MVIRVAAFLLMTGAPCMAAAPRWAPTSVHVVKSGQWHADPHNEQTPEQCALFRLSDAGALRWFRRAAPVDKQVWLEQLDWTQCSAAGTLTARDGKIYSWTLDQSGRGQIHFSDTRAIYLAGKAIPSASH